jgi:hypothetical protein
MKLESHFVFCSKSLQFAILKRTSNFLHMLYKIVKPCQFVFKCILRLCYKAEYDYRAFWKTERPPYNGTKGVLFFKMPPTPQILNGYPPDTRQVSWV